MKKQLLFLLFALSALSALLALPAAGVRASNPQAGEVRNLILMIGDGMGLAQVSMLQIANDYRPTAFDRAQQVALAVTRSANNRVTDSAASGTALATGTKTDNGMLGQDPEGRRLTSSMTRARMEGFATGIVVTCYLQHATPAAFYAHAASRNDTERITRQLLGSNVDVLFGGGRRWLGKECSKGVTFLEAFARRGYFVADSLPQTQAVGKGRVLCVAADRSLPKAPARGDYLPRATGKALELLSANTAGAGKGFMLMVEGSQIDSGCHAGDDEWTLAEMRDFEAAVGVAMDFADRTPGTLVIVTADHETGGLTLPANKSDFTLGENGVRRCFSTDGHTATMVPVYLYGTGADRISGVLDNTELARRIMELLGLE